MVLKEAFEYANTIKTMSGNLAMIFSLNSKQMSKITETHMKSLVDPSLEDVVVDATPDEYDPEKLLKLHQILLEDNIALNKAIADAKMLLEFDIDEKIACNKVIRDAIKDLKTLLSIRKYSGKDSEIGYRFNADGNQVSYKYNVVVESEPNFDRKMILEKVAKLMEEADETSMEIEKAIVNTNVNFKPQINYRGLSFRDVYDMI